MLLYNFWSMNYIKFMWKYFSYHFFLFALWISNSLPLIPSPLDNSFSLSSLAYYSYWEICALNSCKCQPAATRPTLTSDTVSPRLPNVSEDLPQWNQDLIDANLKKMCKICLQPQEYLFLSVDKKKAPSTNNSCNIYTTETACKGKWDISNLCIYISWYIPHVLWMLLWLPNCWVTFLCYCSFQS